MASINTIVKRKQYLWLGIVVVGAASAIGGALYLSDVDMSGNGEAVAEQEPVPDMTGVVDTTFDDKVRQHATTEMQVTAAQMQKQYEEIRRELDVLNKQRGDDQRRIEKLGQDNAALAEQVKALGANPVTATGEPVPQMPAPPPGPEGEPQPGNTPVSFPPQGSVAVPPPTAFYPGNGVTPPPQVTYQSVPVPTALTVPVQYERAETGVQCHGSGNRYSGKCIIVCIRRFFLPEFSLYLHEFNVQCWPGKRAVGYFPLVRGDRFAGDTGAGTDRQWLYC